MIRSLLRGINIAWINRHEGVRAGLRTIMFGLKFDLDRRYIGPHLCENGKKHRCFYGQFCKYRTQYEKGYTSGIKRGMEIQLQQRKKNDNE